MTKNQDYWNTKWKKDTIIYEGRNFYSNGKYVRAQCDSRIFINRNDHILYHLLDQFNLRKKTFNETQLQIQRFVVQNFRYLSDEKNNKSVEHWQFPYESVHGRLMDCEDGAILITNLLIQQGLPNYRVKVQQGWVQEAPTQPQGGHAYCVYLEDPINDKQDWKILDWCYFEDSHIPVESKPLQKDGGQRRQYGEIWFTFNDEYSWQQKSFLVHERVQKQNCIEEITNRQTLVESFINSENPRFREDTTLIIE